MKENICPYCRHKNRNENRFCTQCGAQLVFTDFKGGRLVMLHGDRPNMSFALIHEKLSIGRDQSNSISLNDMQVSRHHAIIINKNDEFWIEDQNSRNGVFVNGKKITDRIRLFHGCIIKLGTTIFRFEHASYHRRNQPTKVERSETNHEQV